jgi:hypothetical protein
MTNSLILNTTPIKCIPPSGCDYATFMRGLLFMESKVIVYEGVEYPDYLIYEDGRVFSFKSNRFLKHVIRPLGYKVVTISNNLGHRIVLVHRLIALAFIPLVYGKPFINHIDANPGNNSIENLEWCTQSENILHAFKIGTKSYIGIKNNSSKIVEQDVRDIRNSSENTHDIAKRYGIHERHVRAIKQRKYWNHIN